MAKYVLDFDQVYSSAKIIASKSENMMSLTNAMILSTSNALNSWTGKAHDNFMSSLETKKNEMISYINVSNQLSEFLIKSADAIADLEDELSKLTI